jgi:hypothetical protein
MVRLVGTCALLTDAIRALCTGGAVGEDASACHAALVLHVEFLEQCAVQGRMMRGGLREIWQDAHRARLPGVDACVTLLSACVGRARTLLAQTDLPSEFVCCVCWALADAWQMTKSDGMLVAINGLLSVFMWEVCVYYRDYASKELQCIYLSLEPLVRTCVTDSAHSIRASLPTRPFPRL